MSKPTEQCSSEGFICPYCKHLHVDSWEFQRGKAWSEMDNPWEHECNGCGRPFTAMIDITITYESKPISKCGQPAEEEPIEK